MEWWCDPQEWYIVIYNGFIQHMPATYENGWWYWADTDADPCPAELISGWVSIKALSKSHPELIISLTKEPNHA